MEDSIVSSLTTSRPDLFVERSRLATDFDQFRHLSNLKSFTSGFKNNVEVIEHALAATDSLEKSSTTTSLRRQLRNILANAKSNSLLFDALKETVAEESMLRLDVTVTSPKTDSRLLVGLSSKWSLRTDRAQDCISQGGKLVSLRRGQMPHYAVVTMEPRPSMLKLLADGSGSVDCVYHVAFDALCAAAHSFSSQKIPGMAKQLQALDRMISQKRIRPFSSLSAELHLLP